MHTGCYAGLDVCSNVDEPQKATLGEEGSHRRPHVLFTSTAFPDREYSQVSAWTSSRWAGGRREEVSASKGQGLLPRGRECCDSES